MAKKENKEQKPKYKVDSKTKDAIHVMPKHFLQVSKKKINIWPIIIIVGVLIISTIIVFVVMRMPNQNQNTNTNDNTNQNVNQNQNTNTNDNTNQNANTNQNTNINTNTNTRVNLPGELPLGRDDDADELSNFEESLYGSTIGNKDSDSDGYRDGEEVASGYSPKDAGLTLQDAGIVATYNNENYSYAIDYPSTWIWREVDNATTVVFNTKTGSFIEVRVIENPINLDLVQFYINQVSGSAVGQLQSVSVNNFVGVLDFLRLTYFVANPNDLSMVYSIVYKPGNRTALDYLKTFEMMVNSFSK